MNKDRTLYGEAVQICALDTFVAIVAGLIMRVRQGIGEPNRIYVLIPGKEDAALA